MRTAIPDETTVKAAQAALSAGSAASWNIDRRTLARVAKGAPIALATLSKIVDRTRKAADFPNSAAVSAPQRQQPLAGGWNLDNIRGARDEQMRGNFRRPVRLAESMRTDDVLYTAYLNRIAPSGAVATKLVAALGERGEIVCRKAQASIQVSRGTIAGIHGALVNHGIAIGYVLREVSDDGTRVDMKLTEWPLEHVRYNHSTEQLETATRTGPMIPIVHGDGYWIVFKKFDVLPWTQDAALLPGALLWAAHAYGISDWASASKSHGQAKLAGTLPEGAAMQQSVEGVVSLTPEAAGMLRTMQEMVSGEAGCGLFPFGAEHEFLANGSNAWQVFSELALDRKKGAAQVYTGTDATLGAAGGAPGVDISQLFGVATTRIQGDFEAICQGLNTGLYQPWTAINIGDSRLAPRFEFELPDPDADQKSEQRASARSRLNATIKDMRDQQLVVDQAVVDRLSVEFGVSPAPQLAAAGETKVTVVLAPTDVAKIVLGIEARNAQGLPPFGDERDNMTISEIDAAAQAKANAPPPVVPSGGPPSPKV